MLILSYKLRILKALSHDNIRVIFKLHGPPCSQGLELIRASRMGDMATVCTLLLQDGADVNFMDEVYVVDHTCRYMYIHVYIKFTCNREYCSVSYGVEFKQRGGHSSHRFLDAQRNKP